jgi:hypothetical protein
VGKAQESKQGKTKKDRTSAEKTKHEGREGGTKKTYSRAERTTRENTDN